MTGRCAAAIALLAAAVAAPAAAQTTGVIRGRVVQAVSGAPLQRALVTLTRDEAIVRQMTTDANGRYEFAALPAGTYSVTGARSGGYLSVEYGQRRPFEPGRPVVLARGQTLADIDLALPRGGVITGRILDRLGEPVVGAEIRVERYQYTAGGQRTLTLPRGGATSTDDRGEFRVYGLMPGEYIVSGNVRQPPAFPGQQAPATPVIGFLQTYHPGTANLGEAQAVPVGVGEEAAVQFTLITGRLVRLSGTVVDSLGAPAAGANMWLTTRAVNSAGASGRGAGDAAANGAFTIANVTPGDHYVQAILQARRGDAIVTEIANVPISVTGDDITGLRVETSPGATVRGRVEWEGTAPHARAGADSKRLRVLVTSADNRPTVFMSTTAGDPGATGVVAEDDSFRIAGVRGPVTLDLEGIAPQWTLKTILVNGAEAPAGGIDAAALADATVRVILTDKLTDVAGSVKTASGQPAREYVVVVLPQEGVAATAATRDTRTARADQSGGFSVRGLPPGRYVAVAVEALEQGTEWDPVFQASIRPAARPFMLSEGQALTLDLELLP